MSKARYIAQLANEDLVTQTDLNLALNNVGAILISTPTITSPTTGTINFIGTVTKSVFETPDTYSGILDFAHWQLSYTSDFAIIQQESIVGNLNEWLPTLSLDEQICYIRVRDGSDGHRSGWSSTVSFTTSNIFIEEPTLTVTGAPSNVTEIPNLSTSAFSVYNGTDTHASTDWEILKTSDNSIVWQSLLSTNKLSIDVPSGLLLVNTSYKFRARHNSTLYGSSVWVEVIGTTNNAFVITIGTAGNLDFGVGPSSENFTVLGLSEMTGTTTSGHDNYGNYQHTDSSVVVHIPKFYYRVGHASAPQYTTYGLNSLEIVGTDIFTNESAANAAGYALHRAFIDGDAEKSGFFFDKYVASKKIGDLNKAVSVKNGNPIGLTTEAGHQPSSTMTGCAGILADAVTLSRARGTGWNNVSVFMVGALAMISLAHAQMSSTITNCAWYNSTYNFPKGCNNGVRQDINDTSVSWTISPDGATKGLTGSASTFAKSTHNGQNSGIADVNGLLQQVAIGITSPVTDSTGGGAVFTNTLYILKKTAFIKDLTAGWDGVTDVWGTATSLATRYDGVTSPITVSADSTSYCGSGTNQVLSPDINGVTHSLCGFLPKNDAASDATGTLQFGSDYIHKYNVTNMYVVTTGYCESANMAGVFFRNMYNFRANGYWINSFRAAAYVS